MSAVTVFKIVAFITQAAAAHTCLSTSAAVLPTGCLCPIIDLVQEDELHQDCASA